MKPPWPIHPLLIGLYPVAFELARHQRLVPLDVAVRPALAIMGGTVGLWVVLGVWMRHARKAAAVASIAMLLAFSYELLPAWWQRVASGRPLESTSVSLPGAWGGITLLGALVVSRRRGDFRVLTIYLNLFATFLIAMPLVAMARERPLPRTTALGLQPFPPGRLHSPSGSPDIYYIVLDSYARADTLQEVFQYDNSPFLNRLARRGFRIIERARANYNWTMLSLASSLNATHLNELVDRLGDDSQDWRPLHTMVRQNRVAESLARRGYRIIEFPSAFPPKAVFSAAGHRYMAPPWLLNAFEHRLLARTPLPALLRRTPADQYALHRDSLRYIFDHLPDVAKLDEPTFTFVHILAPHPPFVLADTPPETRPFSLVGSYSEDEYVRGYASTLPALNRNLEAVVDAILTNSPVPPIIVLQADHGPHLSVRIRVPEHTRVDRDTEYNIQVSILNAYYLPQGGEARLYDTITPVNTFRIIFNYYFDARLDLLGDESYVSPWSESYRLERVVDEAR